MKKKPEVSLTTVILAPCLLLLLLVYCFAVFTTNALAQAEKNTQNNDKKTLTTPCNKLSSFELVVEKGGTYALTLGFHRKSGESKADFEKRLQTDFDGQLAIYVAGKDPEITKYHDFSGFADSPSGETYGPVYTFNVDCPWRESRNVMIMPEIKSKEQNAYTLSLSLVEQNKSLWTDLFGEKIDTENKINKTFKTFAATDHDAITIPTPVERIDMFIDRLGDYEFSVMVPFKEPVISYADIGTVAEESYVGATKILYNNTLLYDMPIKSKRIGFLPCNINGIRCEYYAWGYSFEAKERGIYSFIPVIFSSEESDFKKLSFDNSVFAFEVKRFTGFVK